MTTEALSAVTLATHDMDASAAFYTRLGLKLVYGGAGTTFSTYALGRHTYLNVIAAEPSQSWNWWGRVIIHVTDVDEMHAAALANGLKPLAPPRDAEWGERYFAILDPDGHEVTFARPL